jgi:hypothetical protein
LYFYNLNKKITMIQSIIHLEFNLVTKRYRVVDTTDYVATGISLSLQQMKGLGTIRFNGSIDQQHTSVGDPLIDLEVGDTTSVWYDLPLDVNGEVVNGTWTIDDYSVRVLAIGLQFTSITLPTTIVTDGSNWVYDFLTTGNSILLTGGAPQTVVIASIADGTPDVTITTSTTIANATHDDIDFDVTNVTGSLTHTYSGCVKKTPILELSYDCDSGPTGTFTAVDDTSLGTTTLVTRSMSIYPPSLAPLISAVTTAQSSYTFSQLATGTWEALLSLSLSYTQADGAVLTYSVEARKESKVSCTGSLCGLNKCLETLRKLHTDALKIGVSPFQSTVDSILIYFAKANGYKGCGKMDDYYAQVALIQDLLDSIDCGCEEDENASVYIFNVDADTQSIILQLQSDLQYKLNNGIPTVNDDISTGVQVGAIKQDVNTGIEYRCTNNTIDAAVWVLYYDPSTATLPYKSYVVSLSQPTAGIAPTETVIFNNFPSAPVLGYFATGSFTYVLASTFLLAKTFVVVNQSDTSSGGAIGVGSIAAKRINDGVIVITTRDEANVLADEVLDNTNFESL